MSNRKSHFVDYQQRATEFSVGDEVFPFMFGDGYTRGRVVEVFPAIGMVTVEYPNGSKQHPVEELQRIKSDTVAPRTENVPGGAGKYNVPGGPLPKKGSVRRIAEAFVKKSLYWAARDRKYRATRREIGEGGYLCPKCKETSLKKAIYKRQEGQSVRLLACPTCLFMIKTCDLLGHPDCDEGVL